MRASRLSQKLHKWLGLLVGLQLVIWSISGFYMVIVDIDIIHGDHLVQPAQPISEPDLALFSQQLTSLAQDNPQATAISLSMMNGRATAEITAPDAILLHDIGDGKIVSQIDKVAVKKLAKSYYAGSGAIETLSLISANPPHEIGSRPLPLWRVDFDDAWGTTLYISTTTGALATRRHTLWRVFDFVWMLHIMDYDEREDINNTLLRIVSILAFLLVLSGVWYLYFRLNARAWFKRGAR